MHQIFNEDENQPDPRSWNYQRVYCRPHIRWARIIVKIVLLTIFLTFIFLFMKRVFSIRLGIIAVFCFCFIYLTFNLKKILTGCVQLYQHFAPLSMRSMCRFEPSCSQYMILCLQKYGALYGTYRGIKRIYRCAHGDGGYDTP